MRRARLLALALTLSLPASAAPISFSVDVPLTQGKSAVDAFLQARSGGVSGGTFSSEGWTTTTRNDFMYFALPPGIDARRGRLTTVFSSPELTGPKGYFESYHLVAPFGRTPTPSSPPGRETRPCPACTSPTARTAR